MAERPLNGSDGATLPAQLGELLRADAEALSAYALAEVRLASPALRRMAEHFRADHERHVDELTRLVRAFGGRPSQELRAVAHEMPSANGTLAAPAGDREILRALKAGERASRDRYRVATQNAFPAEVAAVLRRALNDESAHYAWTLEMLDDLEDGRVPSTRSSRAALRGSAALAGLVTGVERRASAAVGRARVGVAAHLGAHPIRSTLVAVGVGVWAATLAPARR